MRRVSLQTRLLVLLALLLAMLWAGLEFAVRRDAAAQAARELERQLHATTDLLLVIERAGVDASAQAEIIAAAARTGSVAAFVDTAFELRRDGREVIRSDPFAVFENRLPAGFSTVAGNDGGWIVLTVIDEDTTRRAAVPGSARSDRAATLRSDLSAPWTLALPVFALAALAAVWIGLRPLRGIERRILRIDPRRPAPIDMDPRRMPRELATLTAAFNDLVERLGRVLTDRRIFASVASHELRTPLAGALIQLDVLKRAPDREAVREKLAQALSHMDRMVTQLLFLANGDMAVAETAPREIDIAALSVEIAGEIEEGRVEVSASGEPARVTGHPDLLRVLLRNLVRNARDAAEGQTVTVVVTGRTGEVRVEVLDRGPGIPEAERAMVFDPFRRGRRGGTGLGLTVAQRIAGLHDGRIVVADRPGGGAAVTAVLRDAAPGDAG